MTRTLILMRHAKSSWDDPHLSDHDRSLNKRGQRSAHALGDWLRTHNWQPDLVLCSTATRTRETLAGLAINSPVRYERALYLASPATMVEVLGQQEAETILLIGHNPGIAELAHILTATPPGHPRFEDMPTGATLVLRFASAIATGSGEVLDFVVPRDLTS